MVLSLKTGTSYPFGCMQWVNVNKKKRGPFSSPQHNVSRQSHYYIAADSRLYT